MSSSPKTSATPSRTPDPLNPLQGSTMPSRNRSLGRDVHIYDANDRTTVLGGLILTNGVTNANFYSMVEIIVLFITDFELQNEESTKIQKTDDPLRPGNYYIHAAGSFSVNNESWLVRTISHASGTRTQCFRDAVRSRDRRCVISGEVAISAQFDRWDGFEAAHIFPIAYEGHWKDHGYDRWITIQPDNGGAINSVQNGLLLDSSVHQLFDNYIFSINPDDDYKIVFFDLDRKSLAGKNLDRQLLDDPQRPIDQLLRWHFRQAVLANMRGAGEPYFEHDFPPGSDIVGDILSGSKAAERMEFELFNRLAAQVPVHGISQSQQKAGQDSG
ncbi:hypothetical protein P152DRAFT_459162 [Eremomyces bilateralis CBS 781.70]|uniref:HNH nuclease domain-containing protein n=1 Tax=Eremomyces bilateralis CBS 781.70 TaxID=1392243 RepID=A0A6G1G132_9PEZI|nr:uncharacterized protein P152DRAFT_459162 [Eremomyces bilateralis CBS 781.70]KAF1811692.1 hypothetical protein P152DRAFT_459162 [Eremomyces bilateralis CBS 781.70]